MGTSLSTIQAHGDKRILAGGQLLRQFSSAQDPIGFNYKAKILVPNVFKDFFDLRMQEGFSTG
jgi:hypothetical protein